MADGRTNQQIADELVITPGTVKSHVKRVLRKRMPIWQGPPRRRLAQPTRNRIPR
jgi:DNA-directed RNA polymerase specialized sigma24 family protein